MDYLDYLEHLLFYKIKKILHITNTMKKKKLYSDNSLPLGSGKPYRGSYLNNPDRCETER